MAETGKKPDPKVVDDSVSTSESKASPDKKSGYVRVKTMYPHSSFAVKDVPTINTDGVVLTAEQAEKVQELAPTYGVRLDVEDVK